MFRRKLTQIDLPEFGAMLKASPSLRRVEVYRTVDDSAPVLLGKMNRWEFVGRELRFPIDDERVLLLRGVRGDFGDPTEEWAHLRVGLEGSEDAPEVRLVQRIDPRWYAVAPAMLFGSLINFGLAPVGSALFTLSLWVCSACLAVFTGIWLLSARGVKAAAAGLWLATVYSGSFALAAVPPVVYATLVDPPDSLLRDALFMFGVSFGPLGLFLWVSMISVLDRLPPALARYRGEPDPGICSASLLRRFGSRLGLERRRLPIPETELVLRWAPGFRDLSLESRGTTLPVHGLDRKSSVPVGLSEGTQIDIGPLHGWPLPDELDVVLGDRGTFRVTDAGTQRRSNAFESTVIACALGGAGWGLWTSGIPHIPFWSAAVPAPWLLSFVLVAAGIVFTSAVITILGVRPALSERIGRWVATLTVGPCLFLPWMAWIGYLFLGDHEDLAILRWIFGVILVPITLMVFGLWLFFLLGKFSLWTDDDPVDLEPRWNVYEDPDAPAPPKQPDPVDRDVVADRIDS